MNAFYKFYCVVVVLSLVAFVVVAGRWFCETPHGDPLPIFKMALACVSFYLFGILVVFVHQVIDAWRKP